MAIDRNFQVRNGISVGVGGTILISSGSSVGIGTTTPNRRFVVAGNNTSSQFNGVISVQTTNTTGFGAYIGLNATSITGGRDWRILSSGTGDTAGAGALSIFDVTAGATRLTIGTGGSVGIGVTNPGAALDVNGSIRESTDGVTYWNIVSQQDIGTLPNQIPLNQYLGQMAYLDQPFLRTGTGNSSSGSVVVDASFLDLYSHTASFSTGFTFQIGNLVSGSELKMYVRNTNASQRTITFQGSETDTGFTNINLAPGFGTAGSGSTNSINLAATNGTTLVWVSNIGGGNIVGGILA